MPYIKVFFNLGYRMVHFFNHSERNEKKEAMELGCFLHNKAAWILDKKVGRVVVMILPKESESSHSLDPYSGPFWIRICIPNADPNPRR